jgi:hypothetical protein
LSFSNGIAQRRLAGLQRHRRPRRDRHSQAVRADRHVHVRPWLSCPQRLLASRPSRTLMATRASCCTAATQSSNSPPTATSSKPATCCSTESCRMPVKKEDFTKPRDQPHDGQRTDAVLSCAAFRRDAHPMAIMTGLVGALSAFYHDSTDINNRGSTARSLRSASSRRCLHWSPWHISTRSASRTCTRSNEPELRGQLPAHDVRHTRARNTR